MTLILSLLRIMPKFKGKSRLATFFIRGKKFNDVKVNGRYKCTYLLPNAEENVGFEILVNGMYESETIDFIRCKVEENGLFLDIGANIGAITVPIAKLRKDINVVAIEAAPWILTYLESNVTSNSLKNVTVINKALSNINGIVVSFFSPQDKFGKGSMAPVFTNDEVKVGTITIDYLASSLKSKISFIKIDIEGFEGLAFEGGEKLLKSDSAPNILFEFVDWAENLSGNEVGYSQKVLLGYGYKLFVFENGKLTRPILTPLEKGSHMIFATKESNL